VKVRVQMFAVARQLAGREAVELELGESPTVADLRRELAQVVPALASIIGHLQFAINADYASDSMPIPSAADVACIPPVSGG
jgi:sulfur-carrier protein